MPAELAPRATSPTKPARTHWDMLRERRSIPELEQLLAERLALLGAGRVHHPQLGGSHVDHA
ncbi:RNA polymerase-binding protein RbpA [Streptoalloteichus hindustanus]|uniref:RNA polymerase-binding protein n=1 Tax=Streptoalloteichus hindustanus TaxID=2017 RepID=A0A1M5DA99_STRHI|nr:RNA polymerase-binding protein RbpA [Streptoalloteichus hindustanus]SHF63871.1 RNA polymerase-binding protein [Streptoalloteichus hindustanus]